MTETEYLMATNRVKISAAKALLADVMPGVEYGVDKEALRAMVEKLARAEVKLFNMCVIED